MAKMRIYEIAKSLNIKSTELVKTLNNNGFEVKSPQSNIEDEAIAFVLKNFTPKKKEEDSIFLNNKADRLEKVAENSKKKEIKVDIKGDNSNTLKVSDKISVKDETHKVVVTAKEEVSPKAEDQKVQISKRMELSEKPSIVENQAKDQTSKANNPVSTSRKEEVKQETLTKDAVKSESKPLSRENEKAEQTKPVVKQQDAGSDVLKEPKAPSPEQEKPEKVVNIIDNKITSSETEHKLNSSTDKKQEMQKEEKRIDSKVENREENRKEQPERRPYQGQNRNNNSTSNGDRPYNRNNNGGNRDRNENGRPYQRHDNNGERNNNSNGDRPYNRSNNNGDRPYNRNNGNNGSSNGD